MKIFLTILILFNINIIQNPEKRNIPILNFNGFEHYLNNNNDSIYLINFWASWCVPCREELPAIEKIGESYKEKKIKILLVSLDFPSQVESRLIPFLNSNKIKSQVILLDDPDQNTWINKVDPEWSGEIPYTIIYGKDFRLKYAKTFTFNELDSIINLKIKLL